MRCGNKPAFGHSRSLLFACRAGQRSASSGNWTNTQVEREGEKIQYQAQMMEEADIIKLRG
jgi:hypothetical protein